MTFCTYLMKFRCIYVQETAYFILFVLDVTCDIFGCLLHTLHYLKSCWSLWAKGSFSLVWSISNLYFFTEYLGVWVFVTFLQNLGVLLWAGVSWLKYLWALDVPLAWWSFPLLRESGSVESGHLGAFLDSSWFPGGTERPLANMYFLFIPSPLPSPKCLRMEYHSVKICG